MLWGVPALSVEGEPIRPMLRIYCIQRGRLCPCYRFREREKELSRVRRVVAAGVASALMLSVTAFPALAIGDGPTPAGECANSLNAVGTPQQGAQGFEGNKTNPGLLQADPIVGPTESEVVDGVLVKGGPVSASNPGVSTGAEGDTASEGNSDNCENISPGPNSV